MGEKKREDLEKKISALAEIENFSSAAVQAGIALSGVVGLSAGCSLIAGGEMSAEVFAMLGDFMGLSAVSGIAYACSSYMLRKCEDKYREQFPPQDPYRSPFW